MKQSAQNGDTMKRVRLALFLLSILLLSGKSVSADSELRFLRELVRRNLFESVEYYCRNEFKTVAANTKYLMAAELVRSRTRQMILSEPMRRMEIQGLLDELETGLLGPTDDMDDPELSLARIALRFQMAISNDSLGDWLRLEADAAPEQERDQRIKEARQTLYDGLERFKLCFEDVGNLRRKMPGDRDFQQRSLALLWSIRSRWSLAQVSLALTFPPGEDRKFSLDKAVEMLSELAALGIADPVVYQSRIELARCRRLLGEMEKCKEQLVILDGVKLTGELLLQAKAELIRYYLAIGAIDEAFRFFDIPGEPSGACPDYDIARLELLLAGSERLRQAVGAKENAATSATQSALDRVLEWVRRIQHQSGPYWGRRARMVLSSSHLAGSPSADASLIKMLADDQYQDGCYTEAVRLYEQASRTAESRHDLENAFRYSAASIGVLDEVLNRLSALAKGAESGPEHISPEEVSTARKRTIDSIRQLSKRFSGHADAPEYHLKAVDLTAEAVREKQAELDDYVALLKEHAEFWPGSRKVPPSLLRAALLVEQQGDMNEALSILEKIPNGSDVGLDAVRSARRCFETLSESTPDENDGAEADWFERRLPRESAAWSEADVASALRAAECRLKLFSGTEDKTKALEQARLAENLLRAVERQPNPESMAKAQIQAMLIRALTAQGRKEEGAEILKKLDAERLETLAPEERRAFQRVRAQLLADGGKTQEAVNLLGELLKQYPDDLSIWEVLAETLTRQESPKVLARAQEYWARIAAGSNPKSELWWTARERIIEIHLKLGQDEKARKQYELLQTLHPELGGSARKARLEKRFEKP